MMDLRGEYNDWQAWFEGRKLPSDRTWWDEIVRRVKSKNWWLWQLSTGRIPQLLGECLLGGAIALFVLGVDMRATVGLLVAAAFSLSVAGRTGREHLRDAGEGVEKDIADLDGRIEAVKATTIPRIEQIEDFLRGHGER